MTSDSNERLALRRNLYDVASLLALPALWRGYDPVEIAGSLLEVLVSLLALDSAYVRLNDPMGNLMIEDWRPRTSHVPAEFVRAIETAPVRDDLGSVVHVYPSAHGGMVRVTFSHAGFPGESGLVLTGTQRPHYPGEHERLLLKMAIDQATVAIGDAQLVASERAARARAEAAVGQRDELLAMITHDLRNPLTAIMTGAQLLLRQEQRHPDDSPEAARLSGIVAQAGRMGRLVDELLDLSRLQMGADLPLRVEVVDLVGLARRLVTYYEELGTRRRFVIEASAPRIQGTWDRDRVERMVDNLLSNAVKYSHEGSAIIIWIQDEHKADGTWAVLAVRDQGVGIPQAELPRVFECYHRGTNVTGHVHGIGIGLASAQRIATSHGGTITTESAEGVGSTFTVRLPQRRAGAGGQADEPACETAPECLSDEVASNATSHEDSTSGPLAPHWQTSILST